jgi:ornithine carbamoyltransferase
VRRDEDRAMSDTKRDLLALDELAAETILALLARARVMRDGWESRRMPQALAGRRVALVVDDYGWRNTTAFELGIAAMGGICARAPVTLAGKEAVADLAAYLGNWVDGVAIRTPDLAALRALAAAHRGSVINARTRQNHPCETLGDLAFLADLWGGMRPVKLAAVAPMANILASWVEAAAVLPIEVVQVGPRAWHAPGLAATEDMEALRDADVVITDCWPDDGDAAELARWQVTEAVLDGSRAVFIPCPPVTRGQEVSEGAMRHPRCRAVEAKGWLLHAQNAVLEWSLGD